MVIKKKKKNGSRYIKILYEINISRSGIKRAINKTNVEKY